MKTIHYSIIGGGYRGLLFAEAAGSYPELFTLDYIFCRRPEKAEKLAAEKGLPVTLEEEDIVRSRPDFVIIAIDRKQMAEISLHWIRLGIPVLCETPPCDSAEALEELWSVPEVRQGMLLVGEQYHRYPVLAAGLRAVTQGKIGKPLSVYLSLCHDYHAASIIRRALGHGILPFTVQGMSFRSTVLETDSRYGRITEEEYGEKIRDLVTLQFADGTFASYDFSGLQYRTFLRGRHLTVRGSRGEWHDKILLSCEEGEYPKSELLDAYIAPEYRILETRTLKNMLRSLKPELVLEEEEDLFAMASMMYDYGRFLQGETAVFPYPIEEAFEDTYTWLLMKKALEQPGKRISSEHMPWHQLSE